LNACLASAWNKDINYSGKKFDTTKKKEYNWRVKTENISDPISNFQNTFLRGEAIMSENVP